MLSGSAPISYYKSILSRMMFLQTMMDQKHAMSTSMDSDKHYVMWVASLAFKGHDCCSTTTANGTGQQSRIET